MKKNKKYMQQCLSTHTLLHCFFGFGLGMILAGVLHLTMWSNILVGLICVVLAIVADLLTGMNR